MAGRWVPLTACHAVGLPFCCPSCIGIVRCPEAGGPWATPGVTKTGSVDATGGRTDGIDAAVGGRTGSGSRLEVATAEVGSVYTAASGLWATHMCVVGTGTFASGVASTVLLILRWVFHARECVSQRNGTCAMTCDVVDEKRQRGANNF